MMNIPVSSLHFSRYEEILQSLETATSEYNRGDCTIVQKARKDLEKIKQQNDDPPGITVAVFGDTGSGKSSLLNALLDQPSLLPTAGMGRACTSVVIKIEDNKTSTNFEADIEFLKAEEWKKEINVLKSDQEQNDSDNDEDADVCDAARAKVTAVYGDCEIADLDTLLDGNTDIAEKLGTVKKLSDLRARDLQDKISTFSETSEAERQLWPIVKQVILKVPNSGLCGSGVKLVDLPGVGDSNPARDNVARKYMQTCDVLMIVTKIQRAIDDKTVKNALGDKLFRQLLMDHTKTVVACTHTDDVKPPEVIRKLKLTKAAVWTEEFQRYKKEEQVLQQRFAVLRRDKQMGSGRETEEHSLIQQQQRLRAEQDEFKRMKTSTCAVQWNEFVRNNIQNKKTSPDYPRDLKVFCVSSSDYIKLSNLLSSDDDDDDKPPVFLSTEETEIPGLRNYLQEIVWEEQKKHRMSLQSNFQAIINDVLMYLGLLQEEKREALKEELKRHLDTLRDQVQSIINETDTHLRTSTFAVLATALDEATQEAIRLAQPISEMWARPREQGGLHGNTYKAAVRRMGIFRATDYVIDMNQDLANPFVEVLETRWTRLFSEQEWIETVKSKIREPACIALTRFTDAIVEPLGDSDTTLLKDRLKTDTLEKLTRLDSLWEKTIERQQRAATHMITDFIQEQMNGTYRECEAKTGTGAFTEMKTAMEDGINQVKSDMFRKLKDSITESLDELKEGFIREAKTILEEIFEDTEKQIMPLWQTQVEPHLLEILERSEGLIKTLDEDFAKYKKDCQQSSSSLERQAGEIPKFAKQSEDPDKAGTE